MSDATLSEGWLAVQRHQQFLENTDHLAHGTEYALTELFDVVDVDTATQDDVDRHFHSRRLNRRRRNYRRERLLADHAEKTVRPALEERVCDASVEAENAEFVEILEHKLDSRNFGLLIRLANGMTYAEISIELGVSENALRAQACRAREKAAALLAA
jgi:hypothetical protein